MKRTHPSDKIFPILLAADEHAQIRVAAAVARVTMAEYIRAKVLGSVTASEVTATATEAKPVTPATPSTALRIAPERIAEPSREMGPIPPPVLDRPSQPVDAFLLDAFGGAPPPC